MNIATDIYTEEELLKALCANNRQVTYEYTLANQDGEILGLIPIEDGKISFDSDNEVMRTFSGTTRASSLISLNSTDYQLTPWLCLKYKNDVVKWPLGRFIINPSEKHENNLTVIELTGYDFGKLALDDKSDARTYAAAGAIYTSIAAQIAGTIYTDTHVETSVKTCPNPIEWEIGTEKIKIINDLLKSISYNQFYFNELGVGQMTPYVSPDDRGVDRIYQDNEQSIIIDGIENVSDKFEIPNKFVRYVENPDAAYLVSTYINADPDSPYSIVSRGRTIVDADSVDDIATQADLDSYVRKVASEKMQATETLQFSTLNMPGHGYRDCLLVSVESYGINAKYIETSWEMDLSRGGTMTHVCQKVVTL